MDRLVSTNSDDSYFIAAEHGPTMEDCIFASTSDDALNVHNFLGYGTVTTRSRQLPASPQMDIGLVAGGEIETCEHETLRSLGRTRTKPLTKRHASELKSKIAQIWRNKSRTTQPDLVSDVVLQRDLPLKIADAVTYTEQYRR